MNWNILSEMNATIRIHMTDIRKHKDVVFDILYGRLQEKVNILCNLGELFMTFQPRTYTPLCINLALMNYK